MKMQMASFCWSMVTIMVIIMVVIIVGIIVNIMVNITVVLMAGVWFQTFSIIFVNVLKVDIINNI